MFQNLPLNSIFITKGCLEAVKERSPSCEHLIKFSASAIRTTCVLRSGVTEIKLFVMHTIRIFIYKRQLQYIQGKAPDHWCFVAVLLVGHGFLWSLMASWILPSTRIFLPCKGKLQYLHIVSMAKDDPAVNRWRCWTVFYHWYNIQILQFAFAWQISAPNSVASARRFILGQCRAFNKTKYTK